MKHLIALCLVAIALPGAGRAQTDLPAPKLRDTLITVLTSTSEGKCSPTLMAPSLQYACKQQMPQLQAMLQRSGGIKDASFMGFQQAPDGSTLEAYRVVFERGQALWMISVDQGGRAVALFPAG